MGIWESANTNSAKNPSVTFYVIIDGYGKDTVGYSWYYNYPHSWINQSKHFPVEPFVVEGVRFVFFDSKKHSYDKLYLQIAAEVIAIEGFDKS